MRELFGLEDDEGDAQPDRSRLRPRRRTRRGASAPGARRRGPDADRHARERPGAGAGARGRGSGCRRRARAGHDHDAGRPRRGGRRQVALGVGARARAARRTRSTSPCTRPRTCPASWPTGSSSSRSPSAPTPRDAICGAPSLGALAAGRARRHEQPAPAGADPGRARRSRGGRDPRQRRHPAAQARRRRGRRDRARAGRPGAARPRRTRPTACSTRLIPAAGQGALALEARAGVAGSGCARAPRRSRRARVCVAAERELVRALGASCNTPVGAHARRVDGDRLELRAGSGLPDGSAWVDAIGSRVADGDVAAPARAVAERMLSAGRRGAAARPERAAARERSRLPRRRRAGGSGSADRARARADRRRDVIVYDRLIPDSALDGARADAELHLRRQGGWRAVEAAGGDRARCWSSTAAPGAACVRLKGGDPFVFGRGGEEAEALRAGRHPIRGRARCHRRRGGAGVRRHPGHPPRRGQRGRVRHRSRGSGEARVRARLGGARRVPGDARLLHGRPAAAARSPSG